MSYVHPAWVEHQRRRWLRPDWQRWMRPDARRFERPDPAERKSFAARLVEQRQSDEEAALATAREMLRDDVARLRWLVKDLKVELATRKLQFKYSSDQARVPKGDPKGGQWTKEGGGDAAKEGDDTSTAISDEQPINSSDSETAHAVNGESGDPGIGHNNGPPLEDAPQIPQQKPATGKEKNNFIKAAARWIAGAIRVGRSVSPFIAAYEVMSWLDTDRPLIEAYQDPPKTLEELQAAVSNTSAAGYNDHHIVEKKAAKDAKFPEKMIEDSDNKVRISTLKHWELTGWYQRRNPSFRDAETGEAVSPRKYLEDKDWAERRRVGLEALRQFEILKP